MQLAEAVFRELAAETKPRCVGLTGLGFALEQVTNEQVNPRSHARLNDLKAAARAYGLHLTEKSSEKRSVLNPKTPEHIVYNKAFAEEGLLHGPKGLREYLFEYRKVLEAERDGWAAW